MFCEFERSGDRLACKRCGFSFVTDAERAVRECGTIRLDQMRLEIKCQPCEDRKQRWNRRFPIGTLMSQAINLATLGNRNRLSRWLAGKPKLLLEMHHGFGDCVQATILLRHLRQLHADWQVDVSVKTGAHTLFAGLAGRAYHNASDIDRSQYHFARTLAWYDPETTYSDSPSTKAERCLREVFGIAPLEELCRYEINPSREAQSLARAHAPSEPFALVHYQGNSARANKNIDEQAIRRVIDRVQKAGLIVVLLDWDARSKLLRVPGVRNFPAGHPIWGGEHGTGDGATLAALAAMSTFNVGIDSGPGHVFGAVDTPAMIVWSRHHPVNYYCLAPNVTHIIKPNQAAYIYGDVDTGVEYFERKYRYHVARRNYRLELPELVEASVGAHI